MKALTVCQPYAELIARGVKPVENRTWPTRFRGYLAIHAGKSRDWLEDGDEDRYPGMVFGAVVCVVRVIACLHIDAEWPERIAHLKQHEHANGPWCWVFARHIFRCEPIPAKGAQGLWEIELPSVAINDRMTRTAMLAPYKKPIQVAYPHRCAANHSHGWFPEHCSICRWMLDRVIGSIWRTW